MFRQGLAITIKMPPVIKYFSAVTFSTDAETIADFKLLSPAYEFTGKMFFGVLWLSLDSKDIKIYGMEII